MTMNQYPKPASITIPVDLTMEWPKNLDTHQKEHTSVLNYGVAGDGSIMTDKIREAITATPDGGICYFPRVAIGYGVDDTITVDRDIDIIMESPIIYKGPHDRPCLVVGKDNDYTMYKHYKLQALCHIQSEWYDPADPVKTDALDKLSGIVLKNVYVCNIEIPRVGKFTNGLELVGANLYGSWANHITLGDLFDSHRNLVITSIGDGWSNGNHFYGGYFNHASSLTTKDRYDIVQRVLSGTYGANSNHFYGPRFEGGVPSISGEKIPIWLQKNASYFKFSDVRGENCSGANDPFIRQGENCQTIDIGFLVHLCNIDVENLSGYPSACVHTIIDTVSTSQEKYLIFDSGPLRDSLITDPNNPGRKGLSNFGVGYYPNSGDTLHRYPQEDGRIIPSALNSDDITVSPQAGIILTVDSTLNKKFIVFTSGENPYVGLKTFDSDGNIILPPYPMTEMDSKIKPYTLFYTDEITRMYLPNGPYPYPVLLEVTEDVYSIQFCFYGDLKRIQIYTVRQKYGFVRELFPIPTVSRGITEKDGIYLLSSPNGTTYMLSVADDGTLTAIPY